jgi:hypothetical protein
MPKRWREATERRFTKKFDNNVERGKPPGVVVQTITSKRTVFYEWNGALELAPAEPLRAALQCLMCCSRLQR